MDCSRIQCVPAFSTGLEPSRIAPKSSMSIHLCSHVPAPKDILRVAKGWV